jgi:IS30 family transposase
MAYRQITSEERYTIAALRREGLNPSQIARRPGRHRSTVSREVRRNSSRSDGSYRPSKAIERTNGRRSRARRNQHFTRADFAPVERKLKQDWSPEQIAGRLRLHGKLSISHETIYIHVWRDKEAGGDLYRHLRCAPKLRRKRHNSYDSRGRLAGKRHISERPSYIDKRRSVGH